MNEELDAYETVTCRQCGTMAMLVDLVGVILVDDKDVMSDEFGYLGDCPTCLSQIFMEDIT